jgi:hypothetical protein
MAPETQVAITSQRLWISVHSSLVTPPSRRKRFGSKHCLAFELAEGSRYVIFNWRLAQQSARWCSCCHVPLGGVYTKPGNGAWLLKNHHQLHGILSGFARDHAHGDDESKEADLRFNSGMTKVYALLLSDFIIYDSRVAAALAWLALDWWTTRLKRSAGALPAELKFGCLAANGSMAPFRNPDPTVFPTLWNSPHRHYTWNVRANWVLGDAHKLAGGSSRFASLREVEAALFQMGDRVC